MCPTSQGVIFAFLRENDGLDEGVMDKYISYQASSHEDGSFGSTRLRRRARRASGWTSDIQVGVGCSGSVGVESWERGKVRSFEWTKCVPTVLKGRCTKKASNDRECEACAMCGVGGEYGWP